MFKYVDDLTDRQGNAIVGASIAVVAYPGNTAVTIYSDDGVTAIANSTVTTDVNGTFQFYAPAGRYNFTETLAGVTLGTRTDVQIFSDSTISIWSGTAGGTANALTLTPSPSIASYQTGQTFKFKSSATANTAATTIAISGLATKAVQRNGVALIGGEIAASQWYEVLYDGAAFQLSAVGSDIFQPSGAGAVATDVQTKLLETVTVTDYGGSGAASASANVTAIQNAINRISALGGGEVQLVTGNNYAVNANITIKKNVKLNLRGATITATGNFHTFSFDNPSTTSTTVSSFTASTGVAVVGSAAGFAVGNIVKLSNGSISIVSEITAISGTNVTIGDRIDFTLSGTLTLTLCTKMNSSVFGGTFVKTFTGNFWDVSGDGNISHCEVIGCNFDAASGVTFAGMGYGVAALNRFHNSGDASFLYDTSHCSILDNAYTYCSNGPRAQFVYDAEIARNRIKNGKNTSNSVGIEISGWDLVTLTDKASQNRILGNSVINAQKGVAGSAIGGIHLHRNCHHNVVSNNISQYNGIGIYLETNNYNNIISDNQCTYNGGYYGVGIELDFLGSFNTITGNFCAYNNGSTTAAESNGIQLRNGPSGANDCTFNVVSNNICLSNGKEGIRLNGTGNIANGNICNGNGTDSAHTLRYEMLVDDAANVSLCNNQLYGGTITQTLRVKNTAGISIVSNRIRSGATNAVLIGDPTVASAVSGVEFKLNYVKSLATERGVYITGISGTRITDVYVTENTIDHLSNGFNALEMDYLDKWDSGGNRLIGTGTASLLGFDSVNRKTGDFSSINGNATFDPGSLADGAGTTTTVTVTGAVLGYFAEASFSLDLQGITLTAWVSAADTVSVRFQNESGGTLDLASGTLRARVRQS